MGNSIDFDSVLSLIDKTITPLYLSATQEIVLRETWEGKTYSEIASEHNYDTDYIKGVGYQLWRILSESFNEQVSKSNFVPLMRQKILKFLEKERSESEYETQQSLSTSDNSQLEQVCHWTTAPHIKDFIGRKKELETLKSWTHELDCHCIIVSGMVGCGKTSLVTKFAKNIRNEFDYVIWFSLFQTPTLETLLNNYLRIIDNNAYKQTKHYPIELNFLLSEFIECLKRKRVLLVLDGLQCVLNNHKFNITFKKTFKEYGQLLRAITTTSHKSLLITTSRIKPTMLEYYSTNKVKFLDLQGFDYQTTKDFISCQNNDNLDEETILPLSRNLQCNPQLLKIAISHLNTFSTDNPDQILGDLSLLEGVSSLLEQEIQYLSDLHKEIIFWLAISCYPLSLAELNYNFEIPQSRVKLLQCIDYLLKRSLIIKQDDTYCLMPIMKNYLRKKLVKTAIQIKDIRTLLSREN